MRYRYRPRRLRTEICQRLFLPFISREHSPAFICSRETDPEPPQRYRLVGEGSGSSGFMKGEATIQLTAANGHTLVDYYGEMQVGGLIAGVGQRMLGGISKMMLQQFFSRMNKELKASNLDGRS